MTQYVNMHSCLFLAEFSSANKSAEQVLLKDLTNLIKINEERKMTELSTYLEDFKVSDEARYIKKDCMRRFKDTRHQSTTPLPAKKLCLFVAVSFDWQKCCFLCSSNVNFCKKKEKQTKACNDNKCGALRDLVAFVQFKKREKHPWGSVNFSKVAGLCK